MSTMESESQAASPFDKATADVVLRSSDDVLFRVHKIILSEASPFFETMFSLPQPAADASSPDSPSEIPVPENSAILDDLLRICYPVPDPPLDTIDRVRDVLAAAIKYDMEAGKVACRKALQSASLLEQPLHVYAVAVQFALKEEAIMAAKATLRVPMDFSGPAPYAALEGLSSTALYLLLQYQQRYKAAALRAIPTVNDSGESSFDDGCSLLYTTCDNCEPEFSTFSRCSSTTIDWKGFYLRVEKVLEATPFTGALLEDSLLRSTIFCYDGVPVCHSCLVALAFELKGQVEMLVHFLEREIAKQAPEAVLGFNDAKSRKRKRLTVED
ncbi:hypothetical protein B0H21DRAFT_520642 [Amylocystis lapponica]|nr:hypothetical protein B0H21DRAFT_520642 [Amylocystis lapponica]